MAGALDGATLLDRIVGPLPVGPGTLERTGDARILRLSPLPLRLQADPIVWIGPIPWVRVHAVTPIARDVEPTASVLERIAQWNVTATTSALVLDPQTRELALRCHATFDMTRTPGARADVLRSVAVAQAAIAPHVARELADGVAGTPVRELGADRRERPLSPLLRDGLAYIRQLGTTTTGLSDAEVAAVEPQIADFAIIAIGSPGILSVEAGDPGTSPRLAIALGGPAGHVGSGLAWRPESMPYVRAALEAVAAQRGLPAADLHHILWRQLEGTPGVGETIALRLTTREPHPLLGNGTLATILLPGRHRATAAAETANLLNHLGVAGLVPLSDLGAWTAHPMGDEWGIAYVSFLPAALTTNLDSDARVAMVGDLVGESLMRATFALRVLADADEDEGTDGVGA